MKTYQVNPDTFAITFWDGINPEPYQFQPDYPNGDPFDSVEEATVWAEASIAAHNPDVMVYPPNGKGVAPEVKPDPNAKEALLARLGMTADEVKLLLS